MQRNEFRTVSVNEIDGTEGGRGALDSVILLISLNGEQVPVAREEREGGDRSFD